MYTKYHNMQNLKTKLTVGKFATDTFTQLWVSLPEVKLNWRRLISLANDKLMSSGGWLSWWKVKAKNGWLSTYFV